MAIPAARVGDATLTAHGCSPTTTILTGSPNVFIDNKAAAFVGSQLALHSIQAGNSCVVHPAQTVIRGSNTVIVNGQSLARVGDFTSCAPGAAITEGSSTVFSG